jgi:hypothetical protein
MARYYFDLRKGDRVFLDEEGTELSTIEAVQQEAVRTVAEMARDAIRGNPDGPGHFMAIEVRDDNEAVLQVKFHWTVELHKKS